MICNTIVIDCKRGFSRETQKECGEKSEDLKRLALAGPAIAFRHETSTVHNRHTMNIEMKLKKMLENTQ